MKRILVLVLSVLSFLSASAQTIPLGTPIIQEYLRRQQLLGKFDSTFSFHFRPIVLNENGVRVDSTVFNKSNYFGKKNTFFNGNGSFRLLPAEFRTSYDSHHPDSRNDGAQIRSRGIQTYASLGFSLELGILSIQVKPEFVFAQNRDYEGFLPNDIRNSRNRWLQYLNTIDLPARYGDGSYKKITAGQSSIRLNKWGLSLGISSENIWWGPGIRNSIMMSNNAQGFTHLTFNTQRPLKSPIGSFEWQFLTGRLNASGFNPSTELIESTTTLFRPKADDWRYFQALGITYSPKWVRGLSLGVTRWAQQYYETAKEADDFFPIFQNVLRENDQDEFGLNLLQDQAVAFYGRWLFSDSKAEFYFEFARNDAPIGIRDFLVDTDHSRAYTLGVNKLFSTLRKEVYVQLNLELTQTSQTEGRNLRNAGSWYRHSRVRHGFTHNGEIIGSGLGSSGNAQYLEVSRVEGLTKIGGAFERFMHNQDFVTAAFDGFTNFTRPWVDYNLHGFINKQFDNILFGGTISYTRSVNYQWKLSLDPRTTILPFFPQINRSNLNIDLKIAYLF